MASFLYLIGMVLFVFPAIIFLDFNRKNTVHIGFIYLGVFVLVFRYVLPWLTGTLDRAMAFAMSVPLLMIIYLIIAKKRKEKKRKLRSKTDEDIIDDF